MQPLVDFWRRLTNLAYAQGMKAEAAEDWRAAIDAYTHAETHDALARVQRRLATEAPADEAVELLRAAQMADPSDAGDEALARALIALAPLVDTQAAAAHRLEAAAIFDRLGLRDAAAAAYEAAGAWHDAADQYAELGQIEAMERVIASGAHFAVNDLTRTGLAERILGVARAGCADDALAALARAREIMSDQHAVDAVEAELHKLLPTPHQLALGERVVCSAGVITVGRDGDLSARLRTLAPIVLTLHRQQGDLSIERDGQRTAVAARTQVDLGGGCMLALRPVPGGWSAALTVRGLPGAQLWLVDRYTFADGTEIVADGRWWRAGKRIAIRGAVIGSVTIP